MTAIFLDNAPFWTTPRVIDQHRADEPEHDRERFATAAMCQALAKIIPMGLQDSLEPFLEELAAIEARWGWQLYPEIMRCE